MNPEEKAVIRENLPKLVSETGDLSNLKAQVVSRDLLSPSEVQTIFNSAPDTEAQLYRFYDTVPRKGPDSFEKLIESLNETNNVHIGSFLRTSLDRKRSYLASQLSMSSGSGDDDVFIDSPRPKRCKLESLRSMDTIEESDDEDYGAAISQDCRIENGKIKSKRLVNILSQSKLSTSVILKETTIIGRIPRKVHLPKLQNYIWKNSRLDESDEINADTFLFFYKTENLNSLQFSDICCTGVNIEINFAGEFVIISDEKTNCVKVGGNRLLDEIGVGGLRNIFSSIKSNNFFPKRIELFDVHITRCPFPIDSSFLIKQMCMRDVSFSKVEILQKTLEVCPELVKLEMCSTTEKQNIELQILQSEGRTKRFIQLSNFDVRLNHYQILAISKLEFNFCSVPENLFLIEKQFEFLEEIIINRCTRSSAENENILVSETFLGSLFHLDNLKSMRLLEMTQHSIDHLRNNNGLSLSSVPQELFLSKNICGQFTVVPQ